LVRLGLVGLLGLFYALAALEVDPGELGDTFGDTYDTYLHQLSPKSTVPLPAPSPDVLGELEPFSLKIVLPHYDGLPGRLVSFPLSSSALPRRRRWHLLCCVWQI
jgi:hypothetical protein